MSLSCSSPCSPIRALCGGRGFAGLNSADGVSRQVTSLVAECVRWTEIRSEAFGLRSRSCKEKASSFHIHIKWSSRYTADFGAKLFTDVHGLVLLDQQEKAPDNAALFSSSERKRESEKMRGKERCKRFQWIINYPAISDHRVASRVRSVSRRDSQPSPPCPAFCPAFWPADVLCSNLNTRLSTVSCNTAV